MNKFGLYDYQADAVTRLKTGSILCGGVGSGKSKTSLAYFLTTYKSEKTKPLYIITTSRKRDGREWEAELEDLSMDVSKVVVNSWGTIKHYVNVEHAFFIFDEQRATGSGVWADSFIKIAKANDWILLSATPGDKWLDYIPVFIANGFYRNRTDFLRQHVIFNRFSKFPQVDRYINVPWLEGLRSRILVNMDYKTDHEYKWAVRKVAHNETMARQITKDRWNPFEGAPIDNAASLCYLARKVSNTHPARLSEVRRLLHSHPKAIVFYNFDYELEKLRSLKKSYKVAEWNGHVHEPLPEGDRWVYLVQYSAGCEAWNCKTTDTIIFYSLNYSYRTTKQASGRIDRVTSPYKTLYYFFLKSDSDIDDAIFNALRLKKDFNEKAFFNS